MDLNYRRKIHPMIGAGCVRKISKSTRLKGALRLFGTPEHDDNCRLTIPFLMICGLPGLLELVSKELNHFGVIADLFRQIGGHSSRFVLFCSF